ncbi:hypothetical protein ACS0TY_004349 [Phlomoides rotata]
MLMRMLKSSRKKVKKWHDARLKSTEFKPRDEVLVFNYRLQLFNRKLRSKWNGSFIVKKMYHLGFLDMVNGKEKNSKSMVKE